ILAEAIHRQPEQEPCDETSSQYSRNILHRVSPWGLLKPVSHVRRFQQSTLHANQSLLSKRTEFITFP
ncbi:MAG TPA: hypothetical protein VI585_06655, partial [Candidatus Binatia bacterium]